MKYEYYDTRAWGQFWPETLFLGISLCFMLVQIHQQLLHQQYSKIHFTNKMKMMNMGIMCSSRNLLLLHSLPQKLHWNKETPVSLII